MFDGSTWLNPWAEDRVPDSLQLHRLNFPVECEVGVGANASQFATDRTTDRKLFRKIRDSDSRGYPLQNSLFQFGKLHRPAFHLISTTARFAADSYIAS